MLGHCETGNISLFYTHLIYLNVCSSLELVFGNMITVVSVLVAFVVVLKNTDKNKLRGRNGIIGLPLHSPPLKKVRAEILGRNLK